MLTCRPPYERPSASVVGDPLYLIPGLIIQPFASIAGGLAATWAMSSEDYGAFGGIQKR